MSRAYRNATDWQALISEWESSPLSAHRFCEQQGIGYASFCQWRKRLKAAAPAATFIDLGALSASAPRHGQGWHIVLSLGNGVELRLSQG
jgi:putative transposase